eukprot:Gregarina_sp_Pseudo_9__2286@NODE_2609_length_938_cov_37_520578_g2393_i0_p1_GENE_NODE_2609_length_938_cov_37_520578_g2393_i0NODE_2609_length_938_cov_37_520578_g2393_i0_p1_ORF_typecomplete_len202_score0_07Hexapep_2/PF14602_6/6_6e05Hexapep_2/PF14602_6/1_1e08Hexapep/PF00132_24/0_012Hexapep/PF00132_24/8_5e09Mac/PF12464_8/4_9e07Mac/PF12464_8/3_3e02_NODE_2609_length_938_cov_37_520578_g2393_i026631
MPLQKMATDDAQTELEKMVSGQLYNPLDVTLSQLRLHARRITLTFNQTGDLSDLATLLPGLAERTDVQITPPLCMDYGVNLYIGNGCRIGSKCVFLDCAPIVLGERVTMCSECAIYTATHPLDPMERQKLLESAKPIRIGDDVLLEPRVVVLPGVSIGDRCVVKTGSVVVKTLPPDTLCGGNPCRPIESLLKTSSEGQHPI